MYNKKNVYFVALLWEDLMFQADNREISSTRKEYMPYPRFTKVIINHFISKDKTISMRNRINLNTVREDTLLEQPAEKPNRAKKPANKFTDVLTAGVVIRDTPTLLEAAQLKKTLKKSKLETHKLYVSGSGDEVGFQPKVPGEQEYKTTGTDEGTGTKPGVPNVPKYLSESENESWGDSGDDESNDNDSNEVTKDNDDDDVDSDVDEKENEEEYARTPDSIKFTDYDEEYEELYKDVNVRLQATEHEEERKRDEEIIDVGRDEGTQQTTYVQVKDDEHITLTTVHDTQKTEVPLQKPSTQTPPLLNIHVTVIPETSSAAGSTILLTISPITPLQQQSTSTPSPTPTTATTETSIPALPDFSSLLQVSTKISGKSAQAEEPVFETADTEMALNQGDELGNTDDQPNIKAALRDDWFKKLEIPLTPYSDWNTTKTIDFRLFLAYVSFMGFLVYQIDVKSAFLYERIEKEVYVCQPTGFEEPDYPDKVYKVEKALYGLHQAPRACYETLDKYLLDNGFQRGKIDQTLLIKRQKGDILLVQVYVDDIIFRSTKKELCTEFEALMHHLFQISSMGELTFFLGLQVKQKSDEIFISQDKYVDEILRKFKYADVKITSTPMDKEKALLKDSDGDDVDAHLY
nr:putative ribonuclease H-like domain-containing protein [Tanacetum cinerariifolium]